MQCIASSFTFRRTYWCQCVRATRVYAISSSMRAYSKTPIDYNPFSFNSVSKYRFLHTTIRFFILVNYSVRCFNLCITRRCSRGKEKKKVSECVQPAGPLSSMAKNAGHTFICKLIKFLSELNQISH